jgi:type I protein arginine methyltransferase
MLKTTLQKPSSSAALALDGGEAFFKSDDYLIPALEDDPLLRRYR